MRTFKVAIASGKGGTGKTTVGTNLAVVATEIGRQVAYLDCDVEEPNGHLFLHPTIDKRSVVHVPVPRVVEDACNECGECGRVCMFSALVWLGQRPLVFPELCHGCGACMLACTQHAIVEWRREVGTVESGTRGRLQFVGGRLRTGEAKSPPVIRAVREAAPEVEWQILDAPPGMACPVVTTVRGCDFVILVTEPTPFGLHDLNLAGDVMRELGLSCGVVINRADAGDDRVEVYCKKRGIPVLLSIPEDRRIAEAYSRGQLVTAAVPGLRGEFVKLWERVEERVDAHAPVGE